MSSNPTRSSVSNQIEEQDADADTNLRAMRALKISDTQVKEPGSGPGDGSGEEAYDAVPSASNAPHHQPADQDSQSTSPPTKTGQLSDKGSASTARPKLDVHSLSLEELWDAAERLGQALRREWVPYERTGVARARSPDKRPEE
ncbi:hypothetical protein FRC00_001114 [Tulasnella sp. 408]|nr:hypothetical protein FRC00_001114 [Tulasnella sp. 408]